MKITDVLIIILILAIVALLVFSIFYNKPLSSYIPIQVGNGNYQGNNSQTSIVNGTLDLSGKNLNSFNVDSISNQNQVKVLNLSNNNLKSLPSQIGQFVNVEELYLDNNLLEGSIVAEIRKMTRLRILSAKNNNLTGIPAEIGQLSSLVTVDFSNNSLDSMPNEIQNIKNNLKTLNLSGNKYSEQKQQEIKTMLPNTNVIF